MSDDVQKFPKTFYYANAIELCERLAHYGLYVSLSLYLTNVVRMTDVEVGVTLGNWRFIASMSPIVCGAIADRITFKRSLIIAFVLYAAAYGVILAYPVKLPVIGALFAAAFAGGFMKPVITGTVIRTSPPGRQTEGFGIFYRMINTGSVVGKTIAYGVRRFVALRFVSATSVIASLCALALAIFAYEEPKDAAAREDAPSKQAGVTGTATDGTPSSGKTGGPGGTTSTPPAQPPLSDVLRGYGQALRNKRFTVFLLIFAGFYFMAEQFYMTFPKYVTRHIDEKAPLEIITLINPLVIALGQGVVTRVMARVHPVTTMTLGVFIGSCSMLVMGAVPTLAGACLSGAIFAVAEMTFSPRFYDYIASFAPKGKAGMYMGLAFVPAAIGAWIGGQASGVLISKYLPKDGVRQPFAIWSTYAGLGVVCALAMVVYGVVTRRRVPPPTSDTPV